MTSPQVLTCYMLKKVLPHVLSIVAFYAIACVFYSPIMLDGKMLVQADTEKYIGMSHETLSYERVEGERPAWTDSMFGGMPTIQITGTGIDTFPKTIWRFLRLLMSPEIMTLFLAMLSAYVLALCIKAPPLVAFIAGATFGLGSINVLYLSAGHATKVKAISMMPGVLAGVIYAYRSNMWGGAAITAFFLSMHIHANHLQMTYYLLYLIAAIGICELVAAQLKGQIKSFANTSALLIGSALVALAPSLPGLKMTKDYSHYTTRGEAVLQNSERSEGLDTDYILEYSFAKAEWLSAIVPDIKGGANQLYWGEQRFSGGAFYFGAIAFALLLAFLFVGKDRMRWPIIATSLLAIILSWRDASFVTDFFLEYVPLFNKFRDTKMMMVLIQLVVVVGVAMSLKRVWDEAGSGKWKPWVYSLGGVAGLLAVFYIIPETIFDFTSEIRQDVLKEQYPINKLISLRVEVFRADVLRSLALVIIAIAAVFITLKGILKREIAVSVLAVIMVLDIYTVDTRYHKAFDSEINVIFPNETSDHDREILEIEAMQIDGFAEKYRENLGLIEEDLGIKINDRTSVGKYLRASEAAMFRTLNSTTHFRVLNWANPMNDAKTSFFFKSVGGYHGAKLRRYQDYITYVIKPQLDRFTNAVQVTKNIEGALPILSGIGILNTKYIINASQRPIQLPNALGPAWVVNNVNWVKSNDEELFSIDGTELSDVAIVHEEFRDYLSEDFGTSDSTSSSVKLLQYHPEGNTYKVSSSHDGLLVMSEIWYPEGWSATVDGVDAELVRANYILRALPISAGDHEVKLTYKPAGAKTAGIISGIGSFLLMAFIAFSWFMCCRNCGTLRE